jgi:hypothetical protein
MISYTPIYQRKNKMKMKMLAHCVQRNKREYTLFFLSMDFFNF